MSTPWKGPRYNSWASNTVLSGIALAIILAATVLVDQLNGAESPPTYLTALLGVAGGAFFGAVGSDKGKREADLEQATETSKNRAAEASETALRAELKADILAEIASMSHPEMADKIPPPLIPKRLRNELSRGEEIIDQTDERPKDGGSPE